MIPAFFFELELVYIESEQRQVAQKEISKILIAVQQKSIDHGDNWLSKANK